MKLYYSKGSCSLAIHIIMNEIGINAEFEAVNLSTKKTSTDVDYFTINPKGSVPALLTPENKILTENAVIQQYLADIYKAHTLLPVVGDFQRYKVLEALNFVSTDLHKSCSPLFNPNVPEDLKETVFRPLLKTRLHYVEKQLQKNKYFGGDHFTLPDSYLFVILTWLPRLKIDITEWPTLLTYFETLKQRESIKKSIQQQNDLAGIT
jgi:glutathione S-transferase